MAHTMTAVPKPTSVSTGVNDAKAVADKLAEALADTYRLMFKTHAYHWNVEGPQFFSIHKLTEEQYEDLFKAADDIAERIRALGRVAPHNMSEIMTSSVIKDAEKIPSTAEMVEDLAGDHEKVAKRLHATIALADEHNDPVTADLLTARSAAHEKAAWMLRAIAK